MKKTIEEIMERRGQIKVELEKPEADLAALEEEVRQLNDAEKEIRANAQKAEELRKRIAEGLTTGNVVNVGGNEVDEDAKLLEVRTSKKYEEAYARYIISGNDKECRALLTTNAASGGSVPVPVVVEHTIHTAWEKDTILSKVNKTEIKGNLPVGFEIDGDDAHEHEEGSEAVSEEDLTLGIVTMLPKNIKKWIRISDEVVSMGGRKFLDYVYSELTYKIMKKLRDLLVDDVANAPENDTATKIGVPSITEAPSLTVVSDATADLSDDVEDVFVIMNRKTKKAFNAVRVAANFAIDPYEGLGVLYCNHLPAYDSASSGDVYMIVGDLKGLQVNYPDGEEIINKYDDLTEAAADMVKVHGHQFAAHALTRKGYFVNVKKA